MEFTHLRNRTSADYFCYPNWLGWIKAPAKMEERPHIENFLSSTIISRRTIHSSETSISTFARCKNRFLVGSFGDPLLSLREQRWYCLCKSGSFKPISLWLGSIWWGKSHKYDSVKVWECWMQHVQYYENGVYNNSTKPSGWYLICIYQGSCFFYWYL